ncbi:MAG: hypothetical protein ACJ8OJ_00145 [Povalibacter sp.]
MIHFGSDTDIDRIGRGVIDCTLPKSDWTHASHFAAAFWMFERSGMNPMHEMPRIIRAYNESTGVANTDTTGYHETITIASLRAVRAWRAERAAMPLHAALESLLESPLGRSDWLLTYWSKPLLFSVEARRSWVDPDLKELPFK